MGRADWAFILHPGLASKRPECFNGHAQQIGPSSWAGVKRPECFNGHASPLGFSEWACEPIFQTLSITIVKCFRPKHDTSIFGGSLDGRQDLGNKHIWFDVVGPCCSRGRRQPQKHLICLNYGPLVPGGDEGVGVAGVLATGVVVELDPNLVEQAGGDGGAHWFIRKYALWGCR